MLTNFVFLTSILAVASAQMSRSCYPAGTQPASDCANFVPNFCNDVAKDSFNVGESGSRCYNLPNGKRCDFIAWNTRKVASPPVSARCADVLNGITQNCPSGGHGLPGPVGSDFFTFTVDPNTGACGQDVQAGN